MLQGVTLTNASEKAVHALNNTATQFVAKELGISEKTTTRRLDRMKDGRLLDLSLQCDPASKIGYVQFIILINVERSHYRDVYKRMYTEFQ